MREGFEPSVLPQQGWNSSLPMKLSSPFKNACLRRWYSSYDFAAQCRLIVPTHRHTNAASRRHAGTSIPALDAPMVLLFESFMACALLILRQDHFNHLPVTLQAGAGDLVNHPEPIRLFRRELVIFRLQQPTQ